MENKFKHHYLIYDIQDNALDFLNKSLDNYKYAYIEETKYEDAKYAILNLSSAIELVLKIKLMEKSNDLIFDNIEDYTLEKFESGDFKSVDSNKLINRLKYYEDVNISFRSDLNSLRRVRNKFEHFRIIKNIGDAKITLIKNYQNVDSFIREFLPDFFSTEYQGIHRTLVEYGIIKSV